MQPSLPNEDKADDHSPCQFWGEIASLKETHGVKHSCKASCGVHDVVQITIVELALKVQKLIMVTKRPQKDSVLVLLQD